MPITSPSESESRKRDNCHVDVVIMESNNVNDGDGQNQAEDLVDGIGAVDAPRCFSLKLATVTQKCGLVARKFDPELCYFHELQNDKPETRWPLAKVGHLQPI